MDIPVDLLVHTVSVEPQSGEGAYGDTYSSPRTVRCFLDYSRQLVRNQQGAEVVSEATLYTLLSEAPYFPADSRVTLPDGSVTYVLKSSRRDDGGLGAPQHLEVVLR